MLHLRFNESLPWSELGGIAARAGIAAVPVLWLTREVTHSPIVGLIAGGLIYAVVYFSLSYATLAGRYLAPAQAKMVAVARSVVGSAPL